MMGQTEKSEKLYEAITELPDEIIWESEEYLTAPEENTAVEGRTSKKNIYFRWALGVAACLMLFCGGIASGLLLAEKRQQGGLTQTKTAEEKEGFQFLVHNMAMNNNSGSTNGNPPEELMSNYMNFNIEYSYTEISDLYRLYGIMSGEAIEEIAYYRGSKDITESVAQITAAETIKKFYQLTSSLVRCDADSFFDRVIDNMSEKEIAKFHEECMTLEITTKSGLVFAFSIYPRTGWLYCGGTMSYYALSDELLDWYEENCKK